MNKVDWTNNGGFPHILNDLEFEQTGVREAFLGLVSAFGITGPDSFVISGCNLAGSYQPGFICLEGEILRFDGHAAITVIFPNVLVWGVDETNDVIGTKVMENTLTREAYKVRRAKIEIVDIVDITGRFPVSPTGATLGSKIAEMSALVNKYAQKVQTAWRTIGAAGQPVFKNSWGNDVFGDGPAQFRITDTGYVELRGSVKGGTRYPMFTLPVGARPTANRKFVCHGGAADNIVTSVYVLPSGDVQSDGDGTTAPPSVSLCTIRFSID